MDADKRRWELNQVTEKIIRCAFTVGNKLGCGFLEKVYENALVHELLKAGSRVEPQFKINVYYDGIVVGEYWADLLVGGCVLVELKAIRTIGEKEIAQCLNYIKATKLTLCLLLNFGNPKVEVRRIVQNF
ncbi:MAG: GxxExxY protein [Cyanobacteriota bacterium]